MDRKDPVGVCYSARNACSEKRPQIRHHRPCVESGKAMRSMSAHFHVQDVLTFISFLFPLPPQCLSPVSPAVSYASKPTPRTQYRLVPRGIFGSRAISNVVSL